MQARRVTKAAILPIGAVLFTVVLALSVTQTSSLASKRPHAAASKIVLRPLFRTTPKQTTHLAATLVTPPLLAVVNQQDIHEDQRIIADAVLRRLPALCRDNLKNFYVLYKNATQRGLGGKTTIILDGNVPAEEFAALLTHECGHVIHGNLLGNSKSGASNFIDGGDTFAKDSAGASFFSISWMTANVIQAGQKKEDFVSGYAQTNAFEDFAETFAMYVLEEPAMEMRAKTNTVIATKLAWMQKNLPLQNNVLGTPLYKWDKKVPWDITKLAYTWNPIP